MPKKQAAGLRSQEGPSPGDNQPIKDPHRATPGKEPSTIAQGTNRTHPTNDG